MRLVILCIFLSVAKNGASQDLIKVNVFQINRSGFRFIRVDENNIKKSATTKFEITDIVCLTKIDSILKKAKKVELASRVGPVNMLCELLYSNGKRRSLLFEDRILGYLKMDSIIYENIGSLEGVVLFCDMKRFDLNRY
jgi:hypothetical protein